MNKCCQLLRNENIIGNDFLLVQNLGFFHSISLEKELKLKFSPIIVRCKRDQIFDWAGADRSSVILVVAIVLR